MPRGISKRQLEHLVILVLKSWWGAVLDETLLTYVHHLTLSRTALLACDSVSLLSSFWGSVNHTSTSAGLCGPVSWIRRTTPNGREGERMKNSKRFKRININWKGHCMSKYVQWTTRLLNHCLAHACIHAKHLNFMAACTCSSQDCSEWLSRWLMSCYYLCFLLPR